MRGVVSAGDPQTAEAGAALLREGGNAVDAAVAAAFAAFVCELPLCSPLGGGVIVVERGSGETMAFDMFARTPGVGGDPRATRDFEGVSVSFGAASQVFHVGRASVAVPLALVGLIEVHRRLGCRPLADVVAPAVALARDGYVLGPGLAYVFDILQPIVNRTPECRALFVDETGAIARAGQRLGNRDMASVLEDIGRRPERVKDLYQALASEMGQQGGGGGLFTPTDVAEAQVSASDPVVVHHRDVRLATMPSPSIGGVLVALGLRMLEGVASAPLSSREHVLFVARVQEALLAERAADGANGANGANGGGDFAARCRDPEAVRALLADERVAVARALARNNLHGSTTQISAIDDAGNAVSLTLTNGEGSGHVLAGTGMIANNFLGEQDLHPRGFHQDPAGAPLMTMMAPTLVPRGNDRIALGSGGSNRLRTAILQVLVGLVEYGLSPEDAVRAPRLHLETSTTSTKPHLAFEAAGLAPEVALALRGAYPDAPAVFDAPNLYFGGVHVAMKSGGVFDGVGDHRRAGARIVV